jgi:hypothetical protein
LQKLRPAHIADWHAKLLREGGEGGRALSTYRWPCAPRLASRLSSRGCNRVGAAQRGKHCEAAQG